MRERNLWLDIGAKAAIRQEKAEQREESKTHTNENEVGSNNANPWEPIVIEVGLTGGEAAITDVWTSKNTASEFCDEEQRSGVVDEVYDLNPEPPAGYIENVLA